MKMRMGHFLPATFAEADQDQWFADEIKKRSGGSIEIEIFWAGSLGAPRELLSLVSSGAVQMAGLPVSYFPNELPLHNVLTLPRTFSDAQTAYEVSGNLMKTTAIIEEQKKNNVISVLIHNTSPYRLACNKPVGSLDEMQGYRVRSVGEIFPAIFNAIGMVPVNTTAGEAYEGLDRGTLDCNMLSYPQMEASKIYEVAKHASDMNLGGFATWQIWVNRELFEGMPKEVQDLIIEVGQEATKRDLEAVEAKLSGSTERLVGHGMTVTKLADTDTLASKAPSALDIWTEKMVQLGLEEQAKEITEIVGPAKERFK